jgi:hypothetical protein
LLWVADTQLVYLWDFPKGVFRSNDGGLTWTLISNLTSNTVRTGSMAVHPTSPSTIYLAGGCLPASNPCNATGVYRISNADAGTVMDGTAVQEKIGTFNFANNVWVDKHGRLFVNTELNVVTQARMEVSWDPLAATPTFKSLVDDYYSNFSISPDGMAVSDEGSIILTHRQQGVMVGLPE